MSPKRRRDLYTSSATTLCVSGAAPRVKIWSRSSDHDPTSCVQFHHSYSNSARGYIFWAESLSACDVSFDGPRRIRRFVGDRGSPAAIRHRKHSQCNIRADRCHRYLGEEQFEVHDLGIESASPFSGLRQQRHIANVFEFLCSDDSSWLAGQILMKNGATVV